MHRTFVAPGPTAVIRAPADCSAIAVVVAGVHSGDGNNALAHGAGGMTLVEPSRHGAVHCSCPRGVQAGGRRLALWRERAWTAPG